jgi:hypothetical protein
MGQKASQTCGERHGPLAGGERPNPIDMARSNSSESSWVLTTLRHDEVLRLQLAQDGSNGSRLAGADLAADDGEADASDRPRRSAASTRW